MISQCQESGTDDEFCQHIANNYNLVVDTFRQDQRPTKGWSLTKILSLQDEVERAGEHPGPIRYGAPGQPDRLGLQPQPRRQGPLPPLGQEEEQSYLDTQPLWPGQCRDFY